MNINKIILTVAIGLLLCGGGVSAYQIQTIPTTNVDNDIVLGPTKIELFMDPGEVIAREITVTNRTGTTVNFRIGIEDIKGSQDPNQSTILMGEKEGPYSLRNWVKPEVEEFTLEHGQRIHLPIEVSIPQDAEPGGHYGVVFASIMPPAQDGAIKDATSGQVSIISRVGTYFFVRISGNVYEQGELKSINPIKKYYETGPITFQLLFENNGSVHLVPYGLIEITNMLGQKVEEIEVDPYFVLPDSLRLREMVWNKKWLFGKYIATASVNRGYDNIADQRSVSFWIIPWKIVLAGLMGLFLIIFFLKWIASKFELKRKT